MADLKDFPDSKRPEKKSVEDMLLGIEFAKHPLDENRKAFLIIDIDYCLVTAGAPRVAEALRNMIRRTPQSFKFVQHAINAMETGSTTKTGGFTAEEIRTLRAATGTENIDPLLGPLKADSTLPERMKAPSREIVAQAERAKAALAQVQSIVDAYKQTAHPEVSTAPEPA